MTIDQIIPANLVFNPRENKAHRHSFRFLLDVQIRDDNNVTDIAINVAYVKCRVGLKDLQSIITKKAFVESAERNGPSWRTVLLRG